MLKCSLILRVPCLASDDKMFACLFVFSPHSRRDIFHFISHPMGVQSNERWVISVKRMNNPFFFRNKLWVIAANDRKNSWTGVTRKDRHQSTLVCLLGNRDIWKKINKKAFQSRCVMIHTHIWHWGILPFLQTCTGKWVLIWFFMLCWNAELHNPSQLILYLLKKPASDGFNVLFVTLNYSSPECNLY